MPWAAIAGGVRSRASGRRLATGSRSQGASSVRHGSSSHAGLGSWSRVSSWSTMAAISASYRGSPVGGGGVTQRAILRDGSAAWRSAASCQITLRAPSGSRAARNRRISWLARQTGASRVGSTVSWYPRALRSRSSRVAVAPLRARSTSTMPGWLAPARWARARLEMPRLLLAVESRAPARDTIHPRYSIVYRPHASLPAPRRALWPALTGDHLVRGQG